MHWFNGTRPAGYVVYQYLVPALITALIGGIGVRTVIALSRRQQLPKSTVPATGVRAATALPAHR
jgi:hypothetical protein